VSKHIPWSIKFADFTSRFLKRIQVSSPKPLLNRCGLIEQVIRFITCPNILLPLGLCGLHIEKDPTHMFNSSCSVLIPLLLRGSLRRKISIVWGLFDHMDVMWEDTFWFVSEEICWTASKHRPLQWHMLNQHPFWIYVINVNSWLRSRSLWKISNISTYSLELNYLLWCIQLHFTWKFHLSLPIFAEA